MVMNKALESELAARIRWAWQDGSPIAGDSPEQWAEMAAIARRRWYSFERRNKNKTADRSNRVDDLARGLCEKFEDGGFRMAGPLIRDYHWLADHLADILENESQ